MNLASSFVLTTIFPIPQAKDLPNKSGDEEDFINPLFSFSLDNQLSWSSTSDTSNIDECDPPQTYLLDSATCMETITTDEFSNMPSANCRKRCLNTEQNTPNKKKNVTDQFIL